MASSYIGMTTSETRSGPVAIGGVGGSGTRVVAQIVRDLGFYLGDDTNTALDNLWFTLLFKRPRWYERSASGLQTGLSLFRKAMSGSGNPTPSETAFLLRATLDVGVRGHDHLGSGRGAWALHRARSLRRAPGPRPGSVGWGWKEPNTHVLLEHLASSFPDLKYVHTIRHGLEMAYSRNQFQLFNWGPVFGVEPPRNGAALPPRALSYWVRANERAIELGRELFEERFLLLRYESLCDDPSGTVSRLAGFLGLAPDDDLVSRLASQVAAPPPPRRPHDLASAGFAPEDLAMTERLGFPI